MSDNDSAPDSEVCDHHADQVGVVIYDADDLSRDVWCSWCQVSADIVYLKSQRHGIGLCNDCKV